MRKVCTIAIINQKGGVGKTTTTLNLGCALSRLGKKALLVDLDPQGNLTSCLFRQELSATMAHVFSGEKRLGQIILHHEEVDLCPADIELSVVETRVTLEQYFVLKDQLAEIEGYDFILFDCPPSLNLFTVNAMIAGQRLIIPVTTEVMSLKGLNQLVTSFQEIRRRHNPGLEILGILFTKFDRRQRIDNEVLQIDTGKLPRFSTVIRRSVELKEAPGGLQSVLSYNPDSRGAEDYLALAREVMGHE